MDKYFVYVLEFVLAQIKDNENAIKAFIKPYVQQGETDIVKLVSQWNPALGFVLQEVVNKLGPDAPKYEGDAIAYVEALIEAEIKKLGG